MPQTLNSTLRFSGVSQNVTVAGASAAVTNAFGSVGDVRLVSTTNCWVNFGKTPTAAVAANNIYLPAGVVEYFHVSPGEKVAVIQDSAGGTLNVAEMTR